MRTVATTKVCHELWDKKVIIEEIREYRDSRGLLAEVWRTDDEVLNAPGGKSPAMCYVSQTKPYVMRGPHQHDAQCDFFYTFHAKMSYHLYNPDTDEMFVYVTDPSKITRVKVDVPIVHGYRNLENRDVFTSNYPTSLFMGKDKKEVIDEIRWEPKVAANQTFVVLGAGGRLGKAIVDELHKTMGLHKHHVIPIYSKFKNTDEVYKLFTTLDIALADFETGKIDSERITVINCAAYANVQKADNGDVSLESEVRWANTEMPLFLCKQTASRNWKLIQFSTDYVFQKLKPEASIYSELGYYTKSKIEMEHQFDISPANLVKGVTVLRVANLYSIDDGEHKHNMIKKFAKTRRNNKQFVIDPHIKVYPTEVSELASYLVKNLANREDNSFSKILWNCDEYVKCNLIPSNSYSLPEFLSRFFNTQDFKIYENDTEPWWRSFEGININNNDNVFVFKTDEYLIHEAIERLKENENVGPNTI